MSTGFEIKLQWPHIYDMTTEKVHHEDAFPADIPQTHEVIAGLWVRHDQIWGLPIWVDVQMWLQDPMGQIQGYREHGFEMAPGDMQLIQSHPVILDLPGRWRLQAAYQFLGWNWNRTWDGIDCTATSHTLTLTSQNGGTIYAFSDGQERTVGPGQTRTFEVSRGSQVVLQAVAQSGYSFRRWTGAPIDGNTSTMVQFQMMAAYNITASWDQEVVLPGALEGNVLEQGTGHPISGATVKSGVYSGQTNLQGFYRITGIPPGSYAFEYSASGYWSEQRGVIIQSDRTTKLDVALNPVDPGNGNGPPPEDGEILKYVLIGGAVIAGAVAVSRIAKRR